MVLRNVLNCDELRGSKLFPNVSLLFYDISGGIHSSYSINDVMRCYLTRHNFQQVHSNYMMPSSKTSHCG